VGEHATDVLSSHNTLSQLYTNFVIGLRATKQSNASTGDPNEITDIRCIRIGRIFPTHRP
jgi:hypothetical protein